MQEDFTALITVHSSREFCFGISFFRTWADYSTVSYRVGATCSNLLIFNKCCHIIITPASYTCMHDAITVPSVQLSLYANQNSSV